MWNAQYSCRMKCGFSLHEFPYDSQRLRVDLKLLQVRYGDEFHLVLGSAQYRTAWNLWIQNDTSRHSFLDERREETERRRLEQARAKSGAI